MASDNVTGQGMFGGVKGSYGRYNVGDRVTNLSPAQFNTMENIEEKQRKRFQRKREPGFVGTGFWYWNYPNMVGTIGAGSLIPTQEEHQELQQEQTREGSETANTGSGMGEGGTAASATGAAGGSPA